MLRTYLYKRYTNCLPVVFQRRLQKSIRHEHETAGSVLAILTQFKEQRNFFLSCIVMGDETWVWYATPESKPQSMELRHTSSPGKKVFKDAFQVMCTVFWERK